MQKGYETKKGKVLLAPKLKKRTTVINGKTGEVEDHFETMEAFGSSAGKIKELQRRKAAKLGLKVRE